MSEPIRDTGEGAVNGRKPLKVLLISNVSGLDPANGDLTYTQQLLDRPPPGVLFVTYDRAIDAGTLTELGTRGHLAATSGVARLVALKYAMWRKGEYLLRGRGISFRENIRFYSPHRAPSTQCMRTCFRFA